MSGLEQNMEMKRLAECGSRIDESRTGTAPWRKWGPCSRQEQEYELLDTGVFDGDRHFDVFVQYAG